MLRSRGMGLHLMRGLTSGNIAGGTNRLKLGEKRTLLNAASPLLLKSLSIYMHGSREKGVVYPSCGKSLRRLYPTAGCSNRNAKESLGDWYINLT